MEQVPVVSRFPQGEIHFSRRVGFLLCVMAFFGSSSGWATRWEPLTMTQDIRHELDADSVRLVQRQSFEAWDKITPSKPQRDAGGFAYREVLVHSRFDCAQSLVTPLQRLYIGLDHRNVREESFIEGQSLQVSSEAQRRLFDAVCQKSTGHGLQRVSDHAPAAGTGGHDKKEKSDGPATSGGQEFAVARKPSHAMELLTTKEGSGNGHAHGGAASGNVSMKDLPEAIRKSVASGQEIKVSIKSDVHGDAHSDKAKVAKKRASTAATHNPAKEMAEKHAEEHPHWSYEEATGPANWAKLNPSNALCSEGKRQSPIDIRNGVSVALEPIQFKYLPSALQVTDNGHTIQVNYGPGSYIKIANHEYELIQFHFHKPSEERVNGRSYDMVIHLVHKDVDNNLAVVAVLLEQGSDNPMIDKIWANLPLEKGRTVDNANDIINVADLLPTQREYWTYNGSLTTPPCTEGVTWFVLKQPTLVSRDQIQVFGRLYKMNARPVQPVNDRFIKGSR